MPGRADLGGGPVASSRAALGFRAPEHGRVPWHRKRRENPSPAATTPPLAHSYPFSCSLSRAESGTTDTRNPTPPTSRIWMA